MNKFKKVLLGALSILTLGLFVVSGAKVNATTRTDGSYTGNSNLTSQSWNFTTNMPTSSYNLAAGDELVGGMIFYSKGSANAKMQTSYLSMNTGVWYIPVMDNSKGTVTVTATSGGTDRILALNDSDSETYRIVMNTSGRSINYTSSQITVYNNKSYLSFTAYKECKVGSIAVTSESDNKTFTSLSVTNSSNYYVDDTFDTSSLTVTAAFDDASNKTLSTSEYSYSFSPALVDGKFSSATTYTLTATATIGEVEKSATTSIIVTDATRHSVTFKQYSTDEKAYKTVSNIVEGESIGTTNWPAEPRVLNKSFEGWFDGDDEYTSNTAITADTTLVAKYTELKNDLVVFGDYSTGLDEKTQITTEYSIIDGVTATGSSNKKKGSKSYTIGGVAFNSTTNSNTFIQCGELTFTLSATSLVTLYGTQTNATNSQTTHIVNTSTNTTVVNNFIVPVKGSETTLDAVSFTLPAGTYKTVQAGLINWYGIRVNQDIKAASATASVFAEKNTAGDTLRFVGTLTGITDLDSIDSIELVLTLNGVATKKQIFLTTCYTSVTGASLTCDGGDGIYYVIYRIKGITGITGTISKQLKVTFTDGSTTLSEVTNIVLA